MTVATWLRPLKAALTRTAPRRPIRNAPPRRLRLEALEDRTVPATITWVNPAGGDWGTPSNWSGGTVPGAADDAVINLGANDFTVTHSAGFDRVWRLTCQASLTLSGGSLKFL